MLTKIPRNGYKQPVQPSPAGQLATGPPPTMPTPGDATAQEATSEAVRKDHLAPLKAGLDRIWLNLGIQVKIGHRENRQKEYYWILLTRRPSRYPKSPPLSELLKEYYIGDIERGVTYYINQANKVHRWNIVFAFIWGLSFLIAFSYLFFNSFPSNIFITIFSHILIVGLVLVLIIPLLYHKHTSYLVILKAFLIILCSLLVAALLVGVLLLGPSPLLEWSSVNHWKGLIEFLQTSLILTGFTCIALIFFLCSISVIHRLGMRLYPVAVATDNLLKILNLDHEWRQSNDGWIAAVEHRQELLLRLEIAARCIEYYLRRQFISNDIVIDAWLTEITKKIGLALRAKKTYIITPMLDSNNHFVDSITSTLACLVKGNWDALEKKEPTELLSLEQLSRFQSQHFRWISLLKKLSKIFVVAVLPLLAFVTLQQTSWRINDPSNMIIWLFTWALLTLISVLNPTVTTNVATLLKDMESSWPPRKN